MEILRSMAILLLTILVILIGAKAIYKDRFAVLTGTVVTNPNTSSSGQIGTIDLALPEGFKSDNCVIVSMGYNGDNYSYGSTGWSFNVLIKDSLKKVNVEAYLGQSLGSTYNLPIKIVLMRID